MSRKKSSRDPLRSSGKTLRVSLAMVFLGIIALSFVGISRAQIQIQGQPSVSKQSQAYITVTSPGQNEVWEKGKRYTIKWESKDIIGTVKILLVGESGKPIEVVRSTVNSGSYNYIVPTTITDGAYRIQVMKTDESVRGESAALTIKGQTLGIAKGIPQTGQASSGLSKYGIQPGAAPAGSPAGTPATQGAATPSPATAPSAATAPSTGATPSAGAIPSTGVSPSAAITPSKAAAPGAAVAGKSPTAAAKIVRQEVKWVKVSEGELKNTKFQPSVASSSNLRLVSQTTAGGKIEVVFPKSDDVWTANNEYEIQWRSTGITGDVKITLVRATPRGEERVPMIERTAAVTTAQKVGNANVGFCRFRVPQNWVLPHDWYQIEVATLDGKVKGYSDPTFHIYSQDVDLQCKIMDPHIAYESNNYFFASTYKEWFEFNVWWKNNGTRNLIQQINPILVRIIKEPEELVVAQEEWGVGQVYPLAWYKLPEPRKFNIYKDWGSIVGGDSTEILKKGAYRVEVELDTQNRLGENQQLREDNKRVVRWHIQ